MIALVGESASGKSTVEKQITTIYNDIEKIVSYTTRKPRDGEIDGVDYHYISEEEFKEHLQNGDFAEYATYNGWHYGILKEDCTDNKVAVVTPHGLRMLKKNKDLNISSFYINVPRRDRLIKILQRGDDIEESYRRNLSDVGQYDGIEDEVTAVINNPGYRKIPLEICVEIMSIIMKGDKA